MPQVVNIVCIECNRDDGVLAIICDEWADVTEWIADEIEEAEGVVWWTHTGVCPNCQVDATEAARQLELF